MPVESNNELLKFVCTDCKQFLYRFQHDPNYVPSVYLSDTYVLDIEPDISVSIRPAKRPNVYHPVDISIRVWEYEIPVVNSNFDSDLMFRVALRTSSRMADFIEQDIQNPNGVINSIRGLRDSSTGWDAFDLDAVTRHVLSKLRPWLQEISKHWQKLCKQAAKQEFAYLPQWKDFISSVPIDQHISRIATLNELAGNTLDDHWNFDLIRRVWKNLYIPQSRSFPEFVKWTRSMDMALATAAIIAALPYLISTARKGFLFDFVKLAFDSVGVYVLLERYGYPFGVQFVQLTDSSGSPLNWWEIPEHQVYHTIYEKSYLTGPMYYWEKQKMKTIPPCKFFDCHVLRVIQAIDTLLNGEPDRVIIDPTSDERIVIAYRSDRQ